MGSSDETRGQQLGPLINSSPQSRQVTHFIQMSSFRVVPLCHYLGYLEHGGSQHDGGTIKQIKRMKSRSADLTNHKCSTNFSCINISIGIYALHGFLSGTANIKISILTRLLMLKHLKGHAIAITGI